MSHRRHLDSVLMKSTPSHLAQPISGSTRVFMVLGDPVSQVKAPAIFNAIFQRHGVDAVLVPAKVPPTQLAGFVRHVMAAANIDGLWVTIPHKPALAALVDTCDAAVAVSGSVNAVRRNADGSLHGGLFDGAGFVQALGHFGFAPHGRSVLLLGAGGAGAAIAVALAAAGVNRIALHDLGDRAATLADKLAGRFGATRVTAASADPAGFDLVVNATPLGLKPGDPLPVDVSRLDVNCTVVDILMTDRPTPLLNACRARGIVAHPGLEMLVQQVPDYLDFFGLYDVAQSVRGDLSEPRALIEAE